MQHIEPLSINLFPIKLALVVLRTERRKQSLRLLATAYHGPRLRAGLARRALSKDELLILILSCRAWRRGGRGEEGPDVAEGQADARAALGGVLGVLGPLVRVYAVHPPRIGREAHGEERVVRERDTLRLALHRRRRTTITVTVPRLPMCVPIGTLLAPSGVLLRPKRHGAPRTEGEIHDARAAHDVNRLV